MKKKYKHFLAGLIIFIIASIGIGSYEHYKQNQQTLSSSTQPITLKDIPKYNGKPYVILQNNHPNIDKGELSSKSFERYSPLDSLGRVQVAVANIGLDLMPKEERSAIGQVKPSGWQTVRYPNIDGKYLYNRSHLIGYQLTSENANERNLMTGTRYFNVNGMLPFENQVADYIKRTGNHVLYRITPLYEGNDLVAKGVIMEAMSDEDQGKGVQFCVFIYNVQPGIEINYKNGKSKLINPYKTAPKQIDTVNYHALLNPIKKLEFQTLAFFNDYVILFLFEFVSLFQV